MIGYENDPQRQEERFKHEPFGFMPSRPRTPNDHDPLEDWADWARWSTMTIEEANSLFRDTLIQRSHPYQKVIEYAENNLV